jgi:hypothetical protein
MQHNWMARGNRDNGWCIENEAGDVVKFDIRILTTTCCIWCGYFQRIEGPATKELVAAAPVNTLVAASAAPRKPIKMPIMKAHDLLGNAGADGVVVFIVLRQKPIARIFPRISSTRRLQSLEVVYLLILRPSASQRMIPRLSSCPSPICVY